MRAWIEVPAGWGWGPVQELKTQVRGAGYFTEEHRVSGHIMLAVTATEPDPVSPPAWPPGWHGDPGPGPVISGAG